MMERLREGANSIWVKIILGLIILSFVFAGVGSYLASGSQQVAAEIDGQEISQNQFEQAYQNERNRMQSQLGDYFATLLGDPVYVKQFRQSVLDRMVNDVLIEQRANELGLRISDEQIRLAIVSMPEFQLDGQFDNDMYISLLRRSGFTPDQFAEYVRTDMLRQQFLTAIQGSDFALSSELTALRKLEAQQRVIRSLTLDLAEFTKNAVISEEEVTAFYEQNPLMFTRPEQVKVAYIELSGESLKDSIEVSEDDAKADYDENKDKYSTAEQRQVSHILIQGDNSEAKAKADDLMAQLKSGADFTQLVQSSSDDLFSAKDGGKLDWFERGVMDPAFEDAAFALSNNGDLSEVVKSSFGYHIIQLNAVKTPDVKPFTDVRDDIIATLREQRAAEHFYEMQTALAETAFEMPDSLDDAAEAVNVNVQRTEFISRDDAEGVLATPAVLQALLSAEVREDRLNSDVIEIGPEHVVVVRVDDAREETVLPFEEVSDAVKAQLASQKGEQNAQAKADEIIAVLRQGNDAVLEAESLRFSEAQTISRSGPDRAVSQVAFGLSKPAEDQPVYGMTRDMSGNVMIIALDRVINADVEPVAVDSQFATQVEQMNAQQDAVATLQVLRATADVSYPLLGTPAN